MHFSPPEKEIHLHTTRIRIRIRCSITGLTHQIAASLKKLKIDKIEEDATISKDVNRLVNDHFSAVDARYFFFYFDFYDRRIQINKC